MNDPFEIPSLEQIEEMERQRLQAIESLPVSDNSSVKDLGIAVPIIDAWIYNDVFQLIIYPNSSIKKS